MSNELSHPLLSVIQRASQLTVEGPTARRDNRFKECSSDVVLLADLSGSMEDLIGSSNLSKEDHLRIAVNDVLKYYPTIRIVAFADRIKTVSKVEELPRAGGILGCGTDLAKALRHAAHWKPRKTIIVSDGMPNSEPDAILAASILTGGIDTIYCGPDDHPAVQFLSGLSREFFGASAVWNEYRGEISSMIRGLIG